MLLLQLRCQPRRQSPRRRRLPRERVNVECIVHHGVSLGVNGSVEVVEETSKVALFLVINNVNGLVLGGVDRLFFGGQGASLLGFVILGRLLSSGCEVDILAVRLRHGISFHFFGAHSRIRAYAQQTDGGAVR